MVYDVFLRPGGISVSNVRFVEKNTDEMNTALLAKQEIIITGFLQDSVYHLPKPQKGQYLIVQYSNSNLKDIFRIKIAELIVHTKGEKTKNI